MHFNPKILGLNIGQFGTIFGSPGQCLSIGFDPGTGVFGFCCVFEVWGFFWPNSRNGK